MQAQTTTPWTSNSTSIFPNPSNWTKPVGIGTQNPNTAYKLSVDPLGSGGILIGNPNYTGGNNTSLVFDISQKENGYSTIQSTKAGGTTPTYGLLGINPLGGVVSIGTGIRRVPLTEYSDEYRLYVARGIRTEKVKVDIASSWADFVFSKRYKLRPLAEVEAFIQQNKHLPDVPSEKQLQKEGLDLGEMQKIQMQKIEELTLYIIELEKRIKTLENSKTQK